LNAFNTSDIGMSGLKKAYRPADAMVVSMQRTRRECTMYMAQEKRCQDDWYLPR
jgi:hypothetical protein